MKNDKIKDNPYQHSGGGQGSSGFAGLLREGSEGKFSDGGLGSTAQYNKLLEENAQLRQQAQYLDRIRVNGDRLIEALETRLALREHEIAKFREALKEIQAMAALTCAYSGIFEKASEMLDTLPTIDL